MKIVCKICDVSFQISPSRLGKIKCCSKRCSNLLKKTTMQGSRNPFYGKKHTEESKRKNKESHIGQISWNKGKKTPEHIKLKISTSLQGNKNALKTGRRDFRGYVGIYSPKHPFRDANNCVREHRLVMEKHLGRFLSHKEVVHHINYDKTDNRLENLILFSNNSEHMSYHAIMRKN